MGYGESIFFFLSFFFLFISLSRCDYTKRLREIKEVEMDFIDEALVNEDVF